MDIKRSPFSPDSTVPLCARSRHSKSSIQFNKPSRATHCSPKLLAPSPVCLLSAHAIPCQLSKAFLQNKITAQGVGSAPVDSCVKGTMKGKSVLEGELCRCAQCAPSPRHRAPGGSSTSSGQGVACTHLVERSSTQTRSRSGGSRSNAGWSLVSSLCLAISSF